LTIVVRGTGEKTAGRETDRKFKEKKKEKNPAMQAPALSLFLARTPEPCGCGPLLEKFFEVAGAATGERVATLEHLLASQPARIPVRGRPFERESVQHDKKKQEGAFWAGTYVQFGVRSWYGQHASRDGEMRAESNLCQISIGNKKKKKKKKKKKSLVRAMSQGEPEKGEQASPEAPEAPPPAALHAPPPTPKEMIAVITTTETAAPASPRAGVRFDTSAQALAIPGPMSGLALPAPHSPGPGAQKGGAPWRAKIAEAAEAAEAAEEQEEAEEEEPTFSLRHAGPRRLNPDPGGSGGADAEAEGAGKAALAQALRKGPLNRGAIRALLGGAPCVSYFPFAVGEDLGALDE
jgi:hypothetical protein